MVKRDDAAADLVDAVCVVGAGPHGLIAMRALKGIGVPFVGIERNADVWGLWDIENPGSPMYESCHYISSKNGSGYFDFPMPDSYPDYPSRKLIHKYIKSFAATYHLNESIEFGTEVVAAEPDGDRWIVTTGDGRVRSFSGLIVCPGCNWHPRFPNFPGHFNGEVIHSAAYRDPSQLAGRRVLVVGLGNSGADIACDATRTAEQVFTSQRRGYHFMPKHLFGIPTMDFWANPDALPEPAKAMELQLIVDVIVGDAERLGFMKPDHKLLQTHPLANTQIVYLAQHGLIKPKPNVVELAGDAVTFSDGTSEEIDFIIYATGYQYRVPFIDEEKFGWVDGHPNLFLTAFCRQHPTLMSLGLLEAGGAPWHLQDQIAVMIAQYFIDRRQDVERADALAAKVIGEDIDLKEGQDYIASDRTVNYVNIPTLQKHVQRIVGELGFPVIEPGFYDRIKTNDKTAGQAQIALTGSR
jgi:hypothetical protein